MYSNSEFLGKIATQARQEKGMTQLELADEMDFDVRTIQKLERGEANPNFTTLVAYARKLQLSLDIVAKAEHTEKGLNMDRLYRQLIGLDTESVDLLFHSVRCYCAWRDQGCCE